MRHTWTRRAEPAARAILLALAAMLMAGCVPYKVLTKHGFRPQTRSEGALNLNLFTLASWQQQDTVKDEPIGLVLWVSDAAGRKTCSFRVDSASLKTGERVTQLPPQSLRSGQSPDRPDERPTFIYAVGALALPHQDHVLTADIRSPNCRIRQTVQLPLIYERERKTITWWDALMSI